MQDLYTEQRARLERLARGKGITCRTCHSAELRSNGQLHPYVGTGFESICGAPMRTPSYKRSPHGSKTIPHPIPGRGTCSRNSHCTRRTINPPGHGRPSDGLTAPPVVT
jgi:hypothetical protein